MSIENAAAEIMRTYLRNPQVGRFHEITEIIRRHLFPSVKPEDVQPRKMYWVRVVNVWALVRGGVATSTQGGFDEIRGPVPCPE